MCGVALGCLLAAGCSMANGRLGPPGRGKGQAWTPIRRKKTLMCRLAVPVGCRMKHAKGMFKRWLLRAGKWPWKAKKEKFHTCGGPRRRPCLGQGRGRRILRFPQKCRFWGKFPLPSQCTTGQMQHGRSRTVGGSIPPRSVPTPLRAIALASALLYLCSF